jgi:hypothetical protein
MDKTNSSINQNNWPHNSYYRKRTAASSSLAPLKWLF